MATIEVVGKVHSLTCEEMLAYKCKNEIIRVIVEEHKIDHHIVTKVLEYLEVRNEEDFRNYYAVVEFKEKLLKLQSQCVSLVTKMFENRQANLVNIIDTISLASNKRSRATYVSDADMHQTQLERYYKPGNTNNEVSGPNKPQHLPNPKGSDLAVHKEKMPLRPIQGPLSEVEMNQDQLESFFKPGNTNIEVSGLNKPQHLPNPKGPDLAVCKEKMPHRLDKGQLAPGRYTLTGVSPINQQLQQGESDDEGSRTSGKNDEGSQASSSNP